MDKSITIIKEEYVNIPVDENMKEMGSVIGELIFKHPVLSDEATIKQNRTDFINKVKIIALSSLNMALTLNPRSLNKYDKALLVKTTQNIIDTYDVDDITTKFNQIVCETLLTEDKNYDNLPIYSNTF